MTFTQQGVWKVLHYGIVHGAVWYTFNDVSEEHATSIFRPKYVLRNKHV
jgi:hypothetical protein